MPIQHATKGDSLADVVERVLDKGLVINADIVISLCHTELLSIKLRAALASFETAAKWGMAFPGDMRIGTDQPVAPSPLPPSPRGRGVILDPSPLGGEGRVRGKIKENL